MRHDPASAAIVIMLRSLKMYGMAQAVTDLIEQGAPAFDAAVPILSQLLKAKMAEREVRSIAYHMKAARFPAYKDISGFDFAASEINEATVRQLHRCEFMDGAQNLVLVGGPGTGKTHVATALGVQAIEHHRRGARVTEAINVRSNEVDLRHKSALLVKTKTDRNSLRTLTAEVAERLMSFRHDAAPDDRVFGYSHRQSVNARIRKICARAGISYKPSHSCGTSSFANNALEMGLDIRTVMSAGNWRSLAVLLGIYVRPHRNASSIVAERSGRYEYRTDI